MIDEFYAIDINEFRQKYLNEKKLDTARLPKVGGKLAKKATQLNISNAEQLNRWTIRIYNRINTYINKLKKKNPELNMVIRNIEMDDWKSQGAAIVVINLKTEIVPRMAEIEISVFDDDQVLIRMSSSLADMFNKGNHRRFFDDKDKVAGYVINMLERVSP